MNSLIDLKAELLRKQEELKKGTAVASKEKQSKVFKKTSVWDRKNKGVIERAQRDLEIKKDEDDTLGKSRKQLELKAKYYESVTNRNDIPDEDGSKLFLVDFQQKALHTISSQREIAQAMEKEKEPEQQNRLLEDLQGTEKTKWQSDQHGEGSQKELKTACMQRKLIHQKWEAIEKDSGNSDGPVHYTNVQHNEIRTHGTGYYQFSKEEQSREEQLKMLHDLREQTKDQRLKKEKLKDKKRSILKARLAKVKRRKFIREGKDPDEYLSESSSSEENLPEKEVSKEPELLVRDENLTSNAPVREWDIGKKEFYTDDAWMKDRRNERNEEFAPPSFYQNVASEPINNYNHGKKVVSKSYTADVINKKDCINSEAKSAVEIERERPSFPDFPPDVQDNKLTESTKITDPMALLEEQVTKQSVGMESDPVALHEEGVVYRDEKILRTEVAHELKMIRKQMEETPTFVKDVNSIPLPKNITMDTGVGSIGSCSEKSTNYSLGNHPNHSEYLNGQVFKQSFHYSSENTLGNENYNPSVTSHSWEQPSIDNSISHYHHQNQCTNSQSISNNDNCEENDNNTEVKTVTKQAKNQPQPAHFSAAPQKIDPRLANIPYQRLNFYEIPDELPAPPSQVNVPSYPSMEEAELPSAATNIGRQDKISQKEDVLIRNWKKQFDCKTVNEGNKFGSAIEQIRPANIPFVSPYVQKDACKYETDKAITQSECNKK